MGCGCRGRSLAAALIEEGHSVRGTTRSPEGSSDVEATGAEAAVADPDRLGTILPLLEGVSVVCWLMGSAAGEPDEVAALHGPRLRSLQEKLVDSGARAWSTRRPAASTLACWPGARAIVREVGETFRMPVAVVDQDPADLHAWRGAVLRGVAEVLAA